MLPDLGLQSPMEGGPSSVATGYGDLDERLSHIVTMFFEEMRIPLIAQTEFQGLRSRTCMSMTPRC